MEFHEEIGEGSHKRVWWMDSIHAPNVYPFYLPKTLVEVPFPAIPLPLPPGLRGHCTNTTIGWLALHSGLPTADRGSLQPTYSIRYPKANLDLPGPRI
jgi:hypothetical protein